MSESSSLPSDAVLVGHSVMWGGIEDVYVGNFSEVGDTTIPRSMYSTHAGENTVLHSGDISMEMLTVILDKFNFLTPATERVWVVGRMLRDSDGGGRAVDARDWLKTSKVDETTFENSLKVLEALGHVHIYLKKGKDGAEWWYSVTGPKVSVLELVSLE